MDTRSLATFARCALPFLIVSFSWAALSAPLPMTDTNTQELLRQQERERQLREQLDKQPDVRTELPEADGQDATLPINESPCFRIDNVALIGDAADRFQWALSAADRGQDVVESRCLGSQGINLVMRRIQNAIIAKGFVTTRIFAGPQDLTQGALTLTVVPGRIREIRYADGSDGQTLTLLTALPARAGDILNLRDVEQGLENLKRVPTAEADIQIEPTDNAGESDLTIVRKQQLPLRVSLSMDDSGSKSTGKYQGAFSLSVDNPLRMNDLFYVSAGHSLFGDSNPRDSQKGTENYNAYYSIPYGYWQLSVSASQYDYHQTVPGYQSNYKYSGKSKNADARLSRILYRDGSRKTTASVRGWMQESKNFIDDAEVEIQRRRTAGWELGLNHREFIGSAIVDANVSWRQGTGAFNAITAPEEEFGEGTSRPRILNADLQYNQPFSLGPLNLRYSNQWRAQWNQTALVPNDRFSIGNRYTVRGFDGEYTLAGERGWFVRNDLGLALGQYNQELYVGMDYGEVDGPSTEWIIGRHLAGAVVGLRGGHGPFSYDLFTGWPVSKPDGMPVSNVTYGFNANLSF